VGQGLWLSVQTLITMRESALHQIEETTYLEVVRRADSDLQATIQTFLGHLESQETVLELVNHNRICSHILHYNRYR
jgi:hypothetical protein